MSLSQHIALVPEAGGVNASELARVCAALQKQLTRDLAPMWGITATINAFPHLEDVPLGYWPIIITFCELGDQAGVHIDKNGQPFAQVEMSPGWSLHASQACLDMLVNPFARKLVAGPSPRPDQGPVEFLLEIAAPCHDGDAAYVIDDVLVSDFCTPAFWGSSSASNHSFSFTGAIRTPHQVLPGGHLTWHDPITDKWWLRHHLDDSLVDTRLGALDGRVGVVREAMRLRAPHALRAEKMSVAAFESRLGVRRQHALQASQFQAHRLRMLVVNSGSEASPELEGRASINTLEIRNEPRRRQLLTHPPAAPDEDAVVEVTQGELLDETHAAHAPSAPQPAERARSAANEALRTKTVPPPLPVEEMRRPEAQAAERADAVPQVPILQTPIPQAPIPRAAPLPPPRIPERPLATGSTVPPISMSRFPATPPQAAQNGWLVAASAIAGAATVLMAIGLYEHTIDSPTSQTMTPAAHVAQAAAPPSPVVIATAAPAPVVVATVAPAIAEPASPPPSPAPPNPAPPAAAAVAPAAPAPTVISTVAPPVAARASPPVLALAAPLPAQPAKVIRPKIAAPAAQPAPRPAPAPHAADDSDPLEGLIGERR